jgi:hypothetical protein
MKRSKHTVDSGSTSKPIGSTSKAVKSSAELKAAKKGSNSAFIYPKSANPKYSKITSNADDMTPTSCKVFNNKIHSMDNSTALVIAKQNKSSKHSDKTAKSTREKTVDETPLPLKSANPKSSKITSNADDMNPTSCRVFKKTIHSMDNSTALVIAKQNKSSKHSDSAAKSTMEKTVDETPLPLRKRDIKQRNTDLSQRSWFLVII